jgi:Na+/proline symporter
MGLIAGVFAATLIYTWFGPRVRHKSIEYDAITVGELIRAAVGFGWLKKTARLDAMVSISMLVSACVYLVMYLRGDFANMLMLMIPVLVNTVMMVIACRYENTGQKLAIDQ